MISGQEKVLHQIINKPIEMKPTNFCLTSKESFTANLKQTVNPTDNGQKLETDKLNTRSKSLNAGYIKKIGDRHYDEKNIEMKDLTDKVKEYLRAVRTDKHFQQKKILEEISVRI